MTFFVHATKGERTVITARLSAEVAIAKGRTLLGEGWEVLITGPDGTRYGPCEFDSLLALRGRAGLEL